jgi:rubrerythrin
MKLKGTMTEKNLLAAFAGESQARNRYTYFASAAKKEGFEQIASIFLETAENEKEHAKRFFKFRRGNDGIASFPRKIGTTAENLLAAAEGERENGTSSIRSLKPTRRLFEAASLSIRARVELSMRSVTKPLKISRITRCSERTSRLPGSAVTAVITTKAAMRRTSAPHACIRRASLNCLPRTTKHYNEHREKKHFPVKTGKIENRKLQI